jgi:branched-chain amino acid transport system permease protein
MVVISEDSRRWRLVRAGGWAVAIVIAIVLPWILGSPADIGYAAQIAAYGVAIMGLNLLLGYTGQISLGHSAFVGIGAYTTLLLVTDRGWPYLQTLPVAIVIAFVLGLIVGVPSLRLGGLYLAAVTLGVSVVFPLVIDRFQSLTGGPIGIFPSSQLSAPGWFLPGSNYGFRNAAAQYLVIIAVTGVLFLCVRNLVRSRIGRALVAIRESPISAETFGVRIGLYKTLVFGVSAALAGAAGTLLMIQTPLANDSTFTSNMSVFLLVSLIVAGRGPLWSALPGGAIYVLLITLIPSWITSAGLFQNREGGGGIAGVLAGVALLVFVFILPSGLTNGLRDLRQRYIRFVPQPALKAGEPAGQARSTT